MKTYGFGIRKLLFENKAQNSSHFNLNKGKNANNKRKRKQNYKDILK